MRKFLIILCVILITNTSCKTDDDTGLSNTCSVSNSIEELDWLKQKIEELEELNSSTEVYISQANYEGKTVFILGNCCELCNSAFPVYNCQGELIALLGCGDEDIDFNILENDTLIWTPENFSCLDSDIFSCG